MKKLYTQLPTNKFFWIILAVFVKSIIATHLLSVKDETYFNQLFDPTYSDSYFYLHSVENFLKTGDYFPDYRMPGMGLLYFILRLVFSIKQAISGIVIVQLLTAAVAVYYLALSVWLITKDKLAFLICFYVFLVSPFCATYDLAMMTESLCTSLLIFYFYNLIRYSTYHQNKSLWIAGLCISSAIFFRPVYLPLIGLPFLIFGIKNLKSNSNWKGLLSLYRVILPFIFFEMLWVGHNYKKHDKFIPLQPSMFLIQEGDVRFNLLQILFAYGGDMVPWNDNAEINWFYNFCTVKTADSKRMENVFPFPENLLQKTTSVDTFYKCKALIHTYYDDTTVANKESIRMEFDGLSKRMISNLKTDYPFYYHFTKRFILLKKFTFNNGTYFLYPESFDKLNIVQKLYKIGAMLIYIGTMILLPFALIIVIIRSKQNKDYIYLWAPVLYTLILFPMILGFVEYKYLTPVFPSIIAVTAIALSYLTHFVRGKLTKDT